MKTLQDLCLEQIMQDFDRHILAYSTFTNLKQSYEALRRRFSHELILQMQEKYDGIRAEYIDFLINKYLKTLDTDWLDNCPWDLIEKKFAEIGPGLEAVQFRNHEKRHNDMYWDDLLRHLPNLKVVDFYSCTDDYLDCISKFCPKIESIKFGILSGISHKGFKYLCGSEEGLSPCSRLKEIIFNEFEPEPEDVRHLIKYLPSLEKINYKRLARVLCSIHEDDLHNLDKIKPYNLTDLEIDVYEIYADDVLKICLSLCPHLKRLLCPVLNQEHLKLCSELTRLEHFSLFNTTRSIVEFDDFFKVVRNKLKSLSLYNVSFSVAHLAQTCSFLDKLQLCSITFLNDHTTVPILCNLKSLTFASMHMNENDILTSRAVTSFITSSPNLERLIFICCNIFHSDIKVGILKCCENRKIKRMSFTGCRVQYKFLHDILLACYSLESLNLCDSALEIDFVKVGLEKMSELEAIASTLPNKPKVYLNSDNSDDD